uniref:Uncharacterized protein n=1 Tax=Gossypium raimondii TaxID=29730 RepID=A0A0D2URU3_GOSRA|nr:hypothetical protein B456_011G118100 [Gossypium raimondii]
MFIDMRPQTDINIGQKGRSVLRRRIKRRFLGENLVGSTPKIPFPLSLDYPAGTRTDDHPPTAEANGRPKYNSNKLYISDLISPRNLSFKFHHSSLSSPLNSILNSFNPSFNFALHCETSSYSFATACCRPPTSF